MKSFSIIFILAFALVFAVRINAQENPKPRIGSAFLSGIVYGSENNKLPLTAITVVGSNEFTFKTISDENGFYKIQIPSGHYEMEFHKYGFKRTIVSFDISTESKTINTTMELGICNDCDGTPYSGELENIRKPDEVDFLTPKEKIGIISGEALDEAGAVLPDLVIKFINNKNEEFQAITNTDGKFSVKLPYGKYKILAEFNSLLKNQEKTIKVNKFENKTEKIVMVCKYEDKKKCFVT